MFVEEEEKLFLEYHHVFFRLNLNFVDFWIELWGRRNLLNKICCENYV